MISGVPMQTSLNARGCRIVQEFLSTLCVMHREYGKVNIGSFMKSYVDVLNGCRHDNPGPAKRKWTEDKLKQADTMHSNGMSWKEVATHFDCSGGAASIAVNDYKKGKRRFRNG